MSFNGANKINPSGMDPAPNWWLIENSGEYVPNGYLVIDVIGKIAQWVEAQPISQWKHSDMHHHSVFMTRYVISEQLYTLLALKWTK